MMPMSLRFTRKFNVRTKQDETVLLVGDGEDELKLFVDSIVVAIDPKLGQGYCTIGRGGSSQANCDFSIL